MLLYIVLKVPEMDLNVRFLTTNALENVERKCAPRAGNRSIKQVSITCAFEFLKGDLERIKIEQPGS